MSRKLDTDLSFEKIVISDDMSLVKINQLGFYLQDYYVKNWIDNTMLFVEVDEAGRYFKQLTALDVKSKYPGVRLIPVRTMSWGKECFLHDPSGILWHFGEFIR